MRTIIQEALDNFDDSLTIVQLLKDEAGEKQDSEYDSLHNTIKDKLEQAQEAEVEDTTPAEDTSAQPAAEPDAEPADESTGSDDADVDGAESDKEPEAKDGTDADSDADDEATPESKNDDPDAEADEPLRKVGAVTESIDSGELRQLSYYTRMALEEFDGSQPGIISRVGTAAVNGLGSMGMGVGAALVNAGVLAAGKAWEFAKYLGGIGIELGKEYGPKAFAQVKKGILYLLTRSLKALLNTLAATAKFVERYRTSVTRTQKDITALQKSLAEMKGHADKPYSLRNPDISSGKLIKWLSVKGSDDIRVSQKVMHDFLVSVIENVDRGVSHDLGVVKRLIDLSATGVRGNLLSFMDVLPLQGSFMKKSMKGYVTNPDLVDSLVYAEGLPTHVLFVANLPKRNLKTIEEIAEAYQAAGLFLATNSEFVHMPDRLRFLSLQDLDAYLESLNTLCKAALERTGLYKRVIEQCNTLKLGYKHYVQTLLASAEEQTVQSSLAEFIHLKQSFVNKAYLPAAMDVHDLVATYLVYAVRFAKANLKAFEQS